VRLTGTTVGVFPRLRGFSRGDSQIGCRPGFLFAPTPNPSPAKAGEGNYHKLALARAATL